MMCGDGVCDGVLMLCVIGCLLSDVVNCVVVGEVC